MSTLLQTTDHSCSATGGKDKKDSARGLEADFEWLDTDTLHEKAGLPAVSVCDENGDSLLLRDADGLLVSRNVPVDFLVKRDHFQARDDDVVIATYPKCGTHWAWEIISMLINGSHTLLDDVMKHIDYLPLDMLDALPSPRVLGTHVPFSRLPRDILSRNCKMIWVVRHPGDVAVSYHAFVQKLMTFGYSGSWDGFLGLYLDGNVAYGSWCDHTQEWMAALESRHNILMVRFEDLLSANFKEEVTRIARFLDVEVSDAMLDAIQRETSFASMEQRKFDYTTAFTKNGVKSLFRNGKSNEWRKRFSVEQAARLESDYEESFSQYSDKLRYTFH